MNNAGSIAERLLKSGRFGGTNRLFVAPERFDLRIAAEGKPDYWGEQVIARLNTLPD